MSDDQGNQDLNQRNQDQSQALGWRAALPTEFKEHEFVKGFSKPGDFVKSALEIKTERDTLKTKLDNSIPKLSKDATDEQKAEYRKAIGVPEKAENYEFLDKDGKPADNNTSKWAKETFFKHGVPAEIAKGLNADWNSFIENIVTTEVQLREKQKGEAETKLKTELGDKYDASVEMVKRTWKKFSNSEFDAFVNETKIGNDPRLISFMINVAKLTGEDISPLGGPSKGENETNWYPNTPGLKKAD